MDGTADIPSTRSPEHLVALMRQAAAVSKLHDNMRDVVRLADTVGLSWNQAHELRCIRDWADELLTREGYL